MLRLSDSLLVSLSTECTFYTSLSDGFLVKCVLKCGVECGQSNTSRRNFASLKSVNYERFHGQQVDLK